MIETATQDGDSLYQQLDPPLELGLPFAPAQADTNYLAWPLLPELFPVSFPGVKTSRDDVVVDIDRERLMECMKLYFDPKVSHEEMRRISPSAMTSTARFNAEAVRDYLRKRGFLPQNIVRYCYRPFDVRWLYWEPEKDFLDRNRAEYFPQVFDGNLWIEARQKQPMEHFDRGYVVRALADNFGNGLSSFFPLFVRKEQPQFSLGTPMNSGAEANLSESSMRYAEKIAASAPDLFYHIISVLHAPAYRDGNASALRQDWPRIPLPDSKELLLASAALGRKIAALLDTETPLEVGALLAAPSRAGQAPPLQKIAVPTRSDGKPLDKNKDLAVTAGWGHAGKDGVTMPGKGTLIERGCAPSELSQSGTAGTAVLTGVDALATSLGGRTCDVYLNDVAYWKNIPLRVWEYTIGGYQVIKKWLSYREEKLLGRPMTKEEVRWVQEMAQRIAAILLLEPALDQNYHAVKAHAYTCPEKA